MSDTSPVALATYADVRRAFAAEKPFYEALDDTFLAPHLVLKGGTFKTWAPPAHIWKALNPAAEAMFEVWYGEETIMLDELGRKTKEKIKHHEKHRSVKTTPGETFDVDIISGPPVMDASKVLSLAEATYGGKRDTDVRPPPIDARPPRSDDGADIVDAPKPTISERVRQRA